MIRKKTKTVAEAKSRPPAELLGGSVAATLSEAAALLALAAPSVRAPSAQVKARLLARICAAKTAATAPATTAAVPAGWRFESAAMAEGWRETFPGVRFKTLSVDDTRDVVMLLVEMAPGARFPDHPHEDTMEDGLVVAGDVRMGGRLLRAGDYYHADAGTLHVDVSSPSGCTAMLSLRASAWRRWREKVKPVGAP